MAALGGAGLVLVAVAIAQDAPADPFEGVQPVMERELSRGIRRAEERIAAGEFTQALRFLDEVLGRDADAFVETGSPAAFVGLKSRAAALLRDLPPAGREAYVAAFAPTAERKLREAVASGKRNDLEAVVRQYFYCPAGQEATLLLARREEDAGRLLSAGLLYDRLLAWPEARRRFDPHLSVAAAAAWRAAGDEMQASAAWDKLARTKDQQVRIGGRPEPLAQGRAASEWLATRLGDPTALPAFDARDWLTHRGNGARNAESLGGLPHMRVRWQVRTLPHPELEDVYDELTADRLESGRLTPPAMEPLAVGDVIVLRTPHTLYGVDFATGKLVWQSEPIRSAEIEQLLPRDSGEEGADGGAATRDAFATRIWRDRLYGVMSSDGEQLYAIRSEPLLESPGMEMWRLGPFGGDVRTAPESTNRLCAYRLDARGAKAWEIDGSDVAGPLPGAFFSGAPIAVGATLYAVVDLRDEVNLTAIDAKTGDIEWRQPLASFDYQIAFDPQRHLNANVASYADGMLVCPTGGGVVVGFDVASRALAWAYPYQRREALQSYPHRVDEFPSGDEAGSWIDAAATIADGKVLTSPPDSNELHCLDLRTGKLLWKRDRGGMIAVACVSEGRVLLIGPQKAIALKLADGTMAWNGAGVAWPAGAAPTGTGFLTGGTYFLPLSNGEVVAVDLAAGKITASVAAKQARPLGNLICHRGAVLSQSGRFLERFDQVDVLRAEATAALADDDQNVDALRTLGEIAMNEGRRGEAISLLERAHRRAPDDVDVGAVLAECLIESLEADFVAHRDKLPLLAQLQDGSAARRLSLLRIQARGLLEVGEPAPAADACLELYRTAGATSGPFALGPDHEAQPARWGRAQIAAIYAASSESEQARIRAEVARLAPVDDESGMPTVRYLEWFGDLPGAEELRLQLARKLAEQQQWLAAQQQFLSLEKSTETAVRAEAVARIARGLHAAGADVFAGAYDVRLAGELAETVCLEGKTGAELAVAREPGGLDWPQGRVEPQNKPTSPENRLGRARMPLWGVPWERADDVLAGASVALISRNGGLLLRDSRGRDAFTTLIDPTQQAAYREPGMSYAVARGSLMVVSTGRQIAAVNTLARGEETAVLWRTNVVGNDARDELPGSPSSTPSRPGTYRPPRAEFNGRWTGVVGPVTVDGVVFHDSRRLVCVDPLSGETLWRRGDVPAGCDLFGDEQVVFVAPRTSRRAQAYSTVDGRALGERAVPSWRERLTTRDRTVIAWESGPAGCKLSAVDVWTGASAWELQFAPESLVDVDAGRLAAVMERAGRIAVIDLATGRFVVDDDDALPRKADEIHLLAGSDALVIAVSQHAPRRPERRIALFNQFDYPTINGDLYVYDRASGAMRWNQPAQLLQQALMQTQGVDLPVIVFASTLNRVDKGGSRASATMLVLDKATGRTLFRSDELNAAAAGYCQPLVASDAQNVVAIEMSSSTLSLRFTDAPRPPVPPSMAEVEANDSESRQGLNNLLRRAFEAVD
ncbi:MAG: PQQ-binding-like beta-propeller repeat protein [Pirellulales bacterium]|nr:PQQ-binding-like beta-propeller repeat protein [Pirellulales bacterium]